MSAGPRVAATALAAWGRESTAASADQSHASRSEAAAWILRLRPRQQRAGQRCSSGIFGGRASLRGAHNSCGLPTQPQRQPFGPRPSENRDGAAGPPCIGAGLTTAAGLYIARTLAPPPRSPPVCTAAPRLLLSCFPVSAGRQRAEGGQGHRVAHGQPAARPVPHPAQQHGGRGGHRVHHHAAGGFWGRPGAVPRRTAARQCCGLLAALLHGPASSARGMSRAARCMCCGA